jgi:geranylgeranyl pyrophosphate synthase
VEETVNIGAAMVLLAGAADIHDDIIDESVIKEPYPTVFGKFGRDIAILAGDALLLKGLYVLHEGCLPLAKYQKQGVLESVKRAFLEICGSEAREASLRGRMDISGGDYLDIIRQKAAAAEASTRIGALLGGGTKKEINLLGHYGRTYGVLMTLRNEFIDIFEVDELKNRAEKECLPLPILLALKKGSTRTAILQLLKKKLTEDNIEKILDLSIDFEETRLLTMDMKKWVEKEISLISPLLYCKQSLELLLWAALEDI